MTTEASNRISQVRDQLISLGFHCLSSGKFGLPSYDQVEAWSKGRLPIYLLLDTKTGGWNLLCEVDEENSIFETWKKLMILDKAQNSNR